MCRKVLGSNLFHQDLEGEAGKLISEVMKDVSEMEEESLTQVAEEMLT